MWYKIFLVNLFAEIFKWVRHCNTYIVLLQRLLLERLSRLVHVLIQSQLQFAN